MYAILRRAVAIARWHEYALHADVLAVAQVARLRAFKDHDAAVRVVLLDRRVTKTQRLAERLHLAGDAFEVGAVAILEADILDIDAVFTLGDVRLRQRQ